MTKEEVGILLKHGDIAHSHSQSFDANNEIFINDDIYILSGKSIDVLTEIFDWYLHIFLEGDAFSNGESMADFKKRVNNKLQCYTGLFENPTDFLIKEFNLEYDKINKLIPDIVFESSNPPRLEDFTTSSSFLLDRADFLQCLKFEVLEGEPLTCFGFPYEVNLPKFYKLDSFFQRYEIQTRFKIIAAFKNIEILKQLMVDLKKAKINHRMEAIVHKYKEESGYVKNLSRGEMRDLGGKNREQAFDSISYFGITKNKKFREITAKELKEAIILLQNYPKAEKAAQADLTHIINS